jgi:hypothetical protein
MVFQSDKTDKECPYCKKLVKNMGYHIANQHPNVFAKIDDTPLITEELKTNTPSLNNNISTPVIRGTLNDLIREKVDTMLNIQIVKMLANGADITDVQKVLQPQQQTQPSIQDIKAMHDILYSDKDKGLNLNVNSESGTDWGNIIASGIQLLPRLLNNRQGDIQNDTEYRSVETGSISVLKPIQSEITGDTTESSSNSKESGITCGSEQQDNLSSSSDNNKLV